MWRDLRKLCHTSTPGSPTLLAHASHGTFSGNILRAQSEAGDPRWSEGALRVNYHSRQHRKGNQPQA
jgi:hypothetical protein